MVVSAQRWTNNPPASPWEPASSATAQQRFLLIIKCEIPLDYGITINYRLPRQHCVLARECISMPLIIFTMMWKCPTWFLVLPERRLPISADNQKAPQLRKHAENSHHNSHKSLVTFLLTNCNTHWTCFLPHKPRTH